MGLREADGRLELSVRDWGPGPEAARTPPSETLGLAMARAVADQLGGSLQLEAAPGGGTRARLELPIVEDLPSPTPRSKHRLEPSEAT